MSHWGYLEKNLLIEFASFLKMQTIFSSLSTQDDELTIIDVRKFKAINKRKFGYEVCGLLMSS